MNFKPFEEMMRADGAPELAIRAFAHHYALLAEGATGLIHEDEISPAVDLPDAESFDASLEALGREHLKRVVIIKLNGGLGTSMGLRACKALLPVKDGQSFLELTAAQARAAGCPLVLMNSFNTRVDSLAMLEQLPPLPGDLPRDFLQHRIPKIDRETLGPVAWHDEHLRWCPPGHGDLFTALVTRGTLGRLRAAGVRYAFVSNADNLGATLASVLLGYMIDQGLPFMMEVADRTPADRKGGHLAVRGGRLILRERAQCAPGEEPTFQDVSLHRYFNTNNLWLDLEALEATLEARGGLMQLPLIRNAKTVDPRDPRSTPVYQLESAMGAAIEAFEGAAAVRVPRRRFSPVKTTADLLRVRSDATALTGDSRVVPATPAPPLVSLDQRYYKLVGDLDRRFPGGAPSLRGCSSLEVEGDWTFGRGVVVQGDVRLHTDAPANVPDGAVLRG